MRPFKQPVKVEKGADLIFWTYYMVDWSKVLQTESDQKCVQCGAPMMVGGPVEDAKGRKYEGFVCHRCKRVIWSSLP